jgi:serine/threonine-protein kinase SRPK3
MVSSIQLLLEQFNVCAGELTPTGDPLDISFETSITCMRGEEKRRFISFLKTILTWRPGDRRTAEELIKDPWLYIDFPGDDDDSPEVQ